MTQGSLSGEIHALAFEMNNAASRDDYLRVADDLHALASRVTAAAAYYPDKVEDAPKGPTA